jgi:hypothetical protein
VADLIDDAGMTKGSFMYRIFALAAIAFVLTLVSPAARAGEMPVKLREQIDQHFIGSWTFSMMSAGETMTGVYTAKWATGKHCVVITVEGKGSQGDIFQTGILAWQPDKDTLVHHGFFSNGDYFRITYDKFDFDENNWSGRVTGLVNGERPDDSAAHVAWHKDSFNYKDDIFTFEAKRQNRNESGE